jgi:hypothetical protein
MGEFKMSLRESVRRACAFTAGLAVATGLACHAARASDPLPGDGIAPPLNVNILLAYNIFSDAGSFGALRGSDDSQHTRISTDISVLRYIRTFSVGGMEAGVQAFLPYVAFLGQQELGVPEIGPAAPGLPPIGPAKANLSSSSGFAQPNLGAFLFAINEPARGTYLVLAPWIEPPVSGFNKNKVLNPSQNVWVYEAEVGFRTILFGTPTTPNLAIEIWGEAYAFGNNTNSAAVSPEVNALALPAIYPEIGVHNPLSVNSATPATFREQPSEELRIYVPYEFAPAIGAFVAPGFYQSFGGKQTYKTNEGGFIVDSGNRTNETQLRLIANTFVSPTTAIMLVGDYDVAAHGQPLNRSIELRIAKFF